MAKITFKGTPIETSGTLPAVGEKVPDFNLTAQDLSDKTLADFAGKKKVFNIYTSVDTGVCANSLKAFQDKLKGRDDVVVLHISADLPFAAKRFCGAEGQENAVTLSTFRSSFPDDWGLRLAGGPIKGLCSRSVVVTDEDGVVLYNEQVSEHINEPDYDKALAALG